MTTSFGKETAPGGATSADRETAAPALALAVLWSESQPEIVGYVAPLPAGETLFLGRGEVGTEKFVPVMPQRPGELPVADPRDCMLTGDTLSRKQLQIRNTGISLEVEQVGRCRTFFNGEERSRATMRPGDTVLLHHELLLMCVLRPRIIPGSRLLGELHPFGEPDRDGIVGESLAAWALREQLALAALGGDHVLIHGESGTGKELAAAVIHKRSARAAGPFIAKNAKTFADSILALELFGNLANWPNPGVAARKGFVGEAHRGTGFLDEVGDLSREAQTQLLRFLDRGGEYQIVGESIARHADVRIVGATNLDLGLFRHDFLARFKVDVRVPPLRERPEDIPLLVRHLALERARGDARLGKPREASAERFLGTRRDGRPYPRLSGRLVDYLVRQPLANNVREIDAFLVKAMNASQEGTIRLPPVDAISKQPPAVAVPRGPNGDASKEARSKEQVVAALESVRGRVTDAAKALGISRQALYRLMESYGIEKKK